MSPENKPPSKYQVKETIAPLRQHMHEIAEHAGSVDQALQMMWGLSLDAKQHQILTAGLYLFYERRMSYHPEDPMRLIAYIEQLKAARVSWQSQIGINLFGESAWAPSTECILPWGPNPGPVTAFFPRFPHIPVVKKPRTVPEERRRPEWCLRCATVAIQMAEGGRIRSMGDIYRVQGQIGTQMVSQFRPIWALWVLAHYGNKSGVFWDPCAGWGARLAGFAASEMGHYIGNEVSPTTIQGLNRIVAVLGLWDKVTITYAPAEDSVLDNEVDLVCTSPPYWNLEQYDDGGERLQSYLRYPSFEAWMDGFAAKLARSCARGLKPGGFVVWNADPLNELPDVPNEESRLIPWRWHDMFVAAGLRHITTHYSYHRPIGTATKTEVGQADYARYTKYHFLVFQKPGGKDVFPAEEEEFHDPFAAGA